MLLMLVHAVKQADGAGVILGALEGSGAVDIVKTLGAFLLGGHQAMGLAGAAHAAADQAAQDGDIDPQLPKMT